MQGNVPEVVDRGECGDVVAMAVDHTNTTVTVAGGESRSVSAEATTTGYYSYRPILLDLQMLETTTGGYRIKELAYKSLPVFVPPELTTSSPPQDRSLHYVCFTHDPRCVPAHRTIDVGGRLHDRYTGLEIACGGEAYSDERVVHELKSYNVIFLKGHNKKRLLVELFSRCAHLLHETPIVVNVDAVTMEDDDRAFCHRHKMTTARFSFRFVYRRFAAYLALMFDHSVLWPADHPVLLNNAVTSDDRYALCARGRSLWVCPYDHRCGRRPFTTQRCAALNVGLLETLWYMMREQDYTRLANATGNDVSGQTEIVYRDRHGGSYYGTPAAISSPESGSRVRRRRQRRSAARDTAPVAPAGGTDHRAFVSRYHRYPMQTAV